MMILNILDWIRLQCYLVFSLWSLECWFNINRTTCNANTPAIHLCFTFFLIITTVPPPHLAYVMPDKLMYSFEQLTSIQNLGYDLQTSSKRFEQINILDKSNWRIPLRTYSVVKIMPVVSCNRNIICIRIWWMIIVNRLERSWYDKR